MATDAAKVEAATAEAIEASLRKKGKSKLLFVVLAIVLLGGGAGAWYAFRPKADAAADSAPAEKPATPKTAALYYKFDPAFVVNFGGEGSARYLQVMVEAMTRDPVTLELIKNNEPAVRNDLVLLFSSQDNASLLSADGKEKLRNATLEVVRKIVASEGGDPKLVESAYFTSFVIQ
jgi:flagellar FliL protein